MSSFSEAKRDIQGEPLLVETPAKTQPKNERRMTLLMSFGLIVLILNAAFLITVVVKLNNAQGTIEQAEKVFHQAQQFMDFPSRLLHGNLARVVANLIQTDYQSLQRNVTRLAAAVQSSFEAAVPSDSDFLQVAKYASLIQSIAKKVGVLQPRFPPVPRPSDDQGVVNVLSYVTEWISTQADKTEIRAAAQSCTALLDIGLNIDWSGTYYWAKGQRYADWNVNSWKDTGETIYSYCDRVATLDPSATDPAVDPSMPPVAPVAPTAATFRRTAVPTPVA